MGSVAGKLTHVTSIDECAQSWPFVRWREKGNTAVTQRHLPPSRFTGLETRMCFFQPDNDYSYHWGVPIRGIHGRPVQVQPRAVLALILVDSFVTISLRGFSIWICHLYQVSGDSPVEMHFIGNMASYAISYLPWSLLGTCSMLTTPHWPLSLGILCSPGETFAIIFCNGHSLQFVLNMLLN